ncbi:MAG: hypothetical protein HQL56_01495 [Magnetococcales bacterium]|nr:hypothetical protein [Magnetococcales bacterium]
MAWIPWMVGLSGERYEFELQMLLACRQRGLVIREVGIATIYHPVNAVSRFRPLRDSARIYRILLKHLLFTVLPLK